MNGEIRKWTENLEVADLFDLDDVQRAFPDKSRGAIKMALGRVCRGDDPVIARITRGVYCRRSVGSRYPVPFPLEARRALRRRVAGPGAGFTGPYLINSFTWSTQVPPCPWIAVVGRPPRCPEAGVVFVGRSNRKRLNLTGKEVDLLEAVRCFDDWAEMSWDKALAKFDEIANMGYYKRTARRDMVLDAARSERGLGPKFLSRCEELADVACIVEETKAAA